MPTCDYCGTWILFGGSRDGDLRFCNDACQEAGLEARVAERLPAEILEAEVAKAHASQCPQCGGPGPIDVRTSYRVFSALAFTRWSSRVNIACLSCGRKAKIADTFFCLFLGWWGFPWGLVMTPLQLGRNLWGLTKGDSGGPSETFRKFIGTNVAAYVLASNREARAQEAREQPSQQTLESMD